jgi:hypothetical protein
LAEDNDDDPTLDSTTTGETLREDNNDPILDQPDTPEIDQNEPLNITDASPPDQPELDPLDAATTPEQPVTASSQEDENDASTLYPGETPIVEELTDEERPVRHIQPVSG